MEELLSGKEASQSLGLQGQLLSGLHSNSYVSIGEEKELKEPTRAMGQRCIGMGESIV